MYEQLGAVESSWCSTSNPQGKCSPLSGVCKPMDANALTLFKALQTQLNRIAYAMKWSKIDVDGRIGPATVSLFNRALGTSLTSCDQLASHVLSMGISDVATKANSINAPASVPAPITSRPSTINPKTGLPEDPPLLSISDSIFGLVSSPFGLLIAGGLAYGAYRLAKGREKKPYRVTPRGHYVPASKRSREWHEAKGLPWPPKSRRKPRRKPRRKSHRRRRR